jgi:exopolysaccharide biosynthesis polyprenyl glycosylphosphotransferase
VQRERATSLTIASLLADLAVTGASFYLAYQWKIHLPGELASLGRISEYGWFFLTYIGLVFFTNYFHGFYTFGRTMTNGEIVTNSIRANVIIMLNVALIFFVFKVQTISRLLFVMFAVLNTILTIVTRLAMRTMTGRLQERGFNIINALVIGTGEQAKDFISNIKDHPELGYRIVGCVDPDRGKMGTFVEGIPLIGTTDELHDLLLRHQVDEVFFAMPYKQVPNLPDMIWACEEIGIRFSLMADFIQTSIAKSSVRYILDWPLLTFSTTPAAVWQLFIKALLDRLVAAVALLLLSPLFFVVAILIKISSRGPVFFTQARCGLNGRLFKMIKFRTMVENAEQLKEELQRFNEMSGPVFKIKEDPRVTGIGRWLRQYSLDELPQFFNVLQGDMSLVGPRPPIPEEVQRYQRWQRRRLSMRPGLTCFWQIAGRNKIDFDEWMKLDLKYIDNWSLKLDFIILGKTIPVVISGHGAS